MINVRSLQKIIKRFIAMKKIRHIISVLVIIMMAVLAAGTFVERLHGTEFALNHVYGTWWFASLWALIAILFSIFIVSLRF